MLYVSFISLGCAKNLVDTEAAVGAFLTSGFGVAEDIEDANILFIGTCSFLKSAREECMQRMSEAAEWKQRDPENRRVIVYGCLAEWLRSHKPDFDFPEPDLYLRLDSLPDVAKYAKKLFAKKTPVFRQPDGEPRGNFGDLPRLVSTDYYAYLKIAEGCSNRCAYCLIPSIRGNLRSRSIESIVCEAKNYLEQGIKELVVIAQDIGSYGADLGMKDGLADLVSALDSLKYKNYILRLLYLHPSKVTDRLCEVLAESKHVARCIEMPVQHIATDVLQRMNRHMTGEDVLAAVKKISNAGFKIRTTLMTGFPGEMEDDFRQMLDAVKSGMFYRLGVFAYSCEEGTPAYSFPDHVPSEIAEERRKKLMLAQKKLSLEQNKKLVGKKIKVIVMYSNGSGTCCARAFEDAPDIDNIVLVSGTDRKKVSPGDIINVTVTSAKAYELFAEIPERKK